MSPSKSPPPPPQQKIFLTILFLKINLLYSVLTIKNIHRPTQLARLTTSHYIVFFQFALINSNVCHKVYTCHYNTHFRSRFATKIVASMQITKLTFVEVYVQVFHCVNIQNELANVCMCKIQSESNNEYLLHQYHTITM